MRKTLKIIALLFKIVFDLVLLVLVVSYALIMTMLKMLKQIAKTSFEIFLYLSPIILVIAMFFFVVSADIGW